MIFSAFLGKNERLEFWQNSIDNHANWLNMKVSFNIRSVNNEQIFAFCWLNRKNSLYEQYFKENDEYIILNTEGLNSYLSSSSNVMKEINENADKNLIQLGITFNSNEIKVLSSLGTSEQFYFNRNSPEVFFSNDLRLMLRFNGFELDETALYAYLKYFAIPAPFTISKNVKRVPNGYMLSLNENYQKVALEPHIRIKEHIFPKFSVEKNSQDRVVQKNLDSILTDVPKSSVLYFSGGIDSALLASRFVELERPDIKLVNFSFGNDDKAGHFAYEVSKHIELPFEQITLDESKVSTVMDNLAKDYSFPFCDGATIPSNLLIRGSLNMFTEQSIALTGIGADCSFGETSDKYHIWKYIYKLPLPIRKQIARIYKDLNIWQYNNNFAKLLTAIRQSTLMPIFFTDLGNIFQNMVYEIPEKTNNLIHQAFMENIINYYPKAEMQEQISFYNLIHSCLGVCNATFAEPLRMQGIKVFNPFLTPEMLKTAFSIPWKDKCHRRESKVILKRMLASKIPSKFVYCSKKSFLTPFDKVLQMPSIENFLNDVVLSNNNEILNFINPNNIKSIVFASKQGYKLNYQAYTTLWAVLFLSGWLSQLKNELNNQQPLILSKL